MRKTFTYLVTATLSICGVVAVSAQQLLSQGIGPDTQNEAERGLFDDHNIYATAATCSLESQSPSAVMQEQIEADSESEDFFIGCGTIM